MQPDLDVRRHADGSIDFDFYRRRAARRRRMSQRVVALLWMTYLDAMVSALAPFIVRTAQQAWSKVRHAPRNLPANPQPAR